MEYYINTPKDGYWIKEDGIKKVENLRSAKYMGYWCTKRLDGESWNEQPVDVFYQPNPNYDLGHSNYFGLFFRNNSLFINDAQSAFSEPINGIICDDGEVLVSRYRHDYVSKNGRMIDGGRDYTRCSLHDGILVEVKDGEFIFVGVN